MFFGNFRSKVLVDICFLIDQLNRFYQLLSDVKDGLYRVESISRERYSVRPDEKVLKLESEIISIRRDRCEIQDDLIKTRNELMKTKETVSRLKKILESNSIAVIEVFE